MSQIIYFIFGIGVGMVVARFMNDKSKRGTERTEKRDDQGLPPGLIERQAREKEENKEKILVYLAGRGEVSNDEVEKLLAVSNATAERYLDELEKEGKLSQVGGTGRSVYYKKA